MTLPAPLSSAALAVRMRLLAQLVASPDVGTRIQSLQAVARALVTQAAPYAPEAVAEAAVVSVCNYLNDKPSAPSGRRYADAFGNSGAASLLGPWLALDVTLLDFVNVVDDPVRAAPAPVPVPVVFDLRFGTSHDLTFTAADFDTIGDSNDGVVTPEVPGPTVRPALWLPVVAGSPLTILRSDLEVPIFSVGPIALLIGGVDGQYWRSDIALRMWSASRLDVRFPA